MTWKIEPSFGVEAFVTSDFRIALKQQQPEADHAEQVLFFGRDEVPALIEILKSVSKEAEELCEQEVANE